MKLSEELYEMAKTYAHNIKGSYLKLSSSEARELAERIQELEAQIPQWISVGDRLPDNNTEVLIVTGKEIIIALYIYEDFYVDGVIEEGFIIIPSHWMPLPKAPENE